MKVNKAFSNGDTATARFDCAWADGKLYRVDVWNVSGKLIKIEYFMAANAAEAMAKYVELRGAAA